MRHLALLLLGLLVSEGGASASTCYGLDPCNACHTCDYCKHCAILGGTCGVCMRGRRTQLFRIGRQMVEIKLGDPALEHRICTIDGGR